MKDWLTSWQVAANRENRNLKEVDKMNEELILSLLIQRARADENFVQQLPERYKEKVIAAIQGDE